MGVKPIDNWKIIREKKERRRQAKERATKFTGPVQIRGAGIEIRGAGIGPVSKFDKKVEGKRVKRKERRVPKYGNSKA